MLSFYGGPQGRSFQVKTIFPNYKALEQDLNGSSNITYGDLVIISYGKFNSIDFDRNKEIDQGVNYNATLWQKVYGDIGPKFSGTLEEKQKKEIISTQDANKKYVLIAALSYPGEGLIVKGHYDTSSQLPKNPKPGDCYSVGSDNIIHIYHEGEGWHSYGKLSGIKGDKGDPGIQGPPGKDGRVFWTEFSQ